MEHQESLHLVFGGIADFQGLELDLILDIIVLLFSTIMITSEESRSFKDNKFLIHHLQAMRCDFGIWEGKITFCILLRVV